MSKMSSMISRRSTAKGTMRIDSFDGRKKEKTTMMKKIRGTLIPKTTRSDSSGLIRARTLSTLRNSTVKNQNQRSKYRGNISNISDAFSLISIALYERFEKEDVIDMRMQKHFVDNIDSAPPQTDGERALVNNLIEKGREIDQKAKRVYGTVLDRVEKFMLYGKQGKTIGWGKTTAIIDVSAKSLFAKIWLINTYEKKRAFKEGNGKLPRAIWENLDNSRSLQCLTSRKFPQGVQHRFFDSWITWQVDTLEDGVKRYVVAFVPIEEYDGSRYTLKGTEKMTRGLSRGMHVIKELTENTCEWHRVQFVDINFGLPKPIMDMMTKSYLGERHRIARRRAEKARS